jgi:Escherichia/Staphylococcus phage prohead protease
METRILQFRSNLRVRKTSGGLKVGGYAARYGVLSHNLGNFKERIAPGAFDQILRSKPDVVALVNHDANKVLGRTTAGTLQLRSDSDGLNFDCDLPNTQTARDLHASVVRGDMNGCSFAFTLGDGDDSFDEENDEEERGKRVIVRTIKNFSTLHDVSIVTTPAYPNTSVEPRNLIAAEVRSRIESFRSPGIVGGMTLKDRIECDAWFRSQHEKDAENEVRARRNRLLGLLDQI